MRAVNGFQVTHYAQIAERDYSQRQFTYGWLLNRIQ